MDCLGPRNIAAMAKGSYQISDAGLQARREVGAEETSLFTRRDLWAPLFPSSPPSSDTGRFTCIDFQFIAWVGAKSTLTQFGWWREGGRPIS